VSGVVVHYSDSAAFGGSELAMLRTARAQAPQWKTLILHHHDNGSALVEHAAGFGLDALHVPRIRSKWDLRGFTRFRSQLLEMRCTVFHAHQHWPLACRHGITAARFAGVPAVVATAQLFEDVPSRGFAMQQYQLVERMLDAHIAVSEHVATQLRRRFNGARHKLRVIHNGTVTGDGSSFDTGAIRREFSTGHSPIILAPARLDEQKGLTWLLKALPAVPDAKVIIAGEGPLRGALEAEARSLGLQDRVHFPGYRGDMPALMAASSIVVLPSLNEGLPIVVLEAMEASRAVVATAIGGTDEAVVHGETGLLVPARDPRTLGDALLTLTMDAALARRMGEAGQLRVREHFSLPAKVREITELYDKVLGANGQSAIRG
jgi:glycosyltransferase involved in cell wall biosynthesis